MIDPQESHVFAVGISSYDHLGPGWKLPNAAEHALAFAAWARQHHVPREHVHLFLSKADRDQLADKLAKADVEARPATFSTILDFAYQELTKKTGDLLYIFWAGHGSVSEDGFRVLFAEDATLTTPLPFDLNDLFARLRTASYQRFPTQIAFIDACANRFEELGFDASLGQVRVGKSRYSQSGIRQAFFLAADSGEQAQEGAFGAAVLKALEEITTRDGTWPPDQDAIVDIVRPQFEKSEQHPVQLVWTTAAGDVYGIERMSGDLPGSRSVNAAALSRKLPVRALRRLAGIAVQYGQLADPTDAGAAQRDSLYANLCTSTNRPTLRLPRSRPRIEMLHLVGAALQWNEETRLAAELGRLAPAAEFSIEIERLALIQQVRAIIESLPATIAELHDEYLKTISRLSDETARTQAATIDAMLDELYQISSADEPQRPLWEFLLRLADRFPRDQARIDDFLTAKGVSAVTLHTLRSELAKEQLFVLSISLKPAHTDEPTIESINASLAIAGTSRIVHAFAPQSVTTWDAVEARAAEIVSESRRIVLQRYLRDEGALLIEFLMPAVFLTRTPDRFTVKIGTVKRLLGGLHAVVVRVRDRMEERHHAINLSEWESIARRIDRNRVSTVHWMDQTRATPTAETCQGLVVLQFLPSDDLPDIVNDGFPFMAWLRREPEGGDWNAFVRRFQEWTSARPLKSLARDVRRIRRKPADLGMDMTLLWDDPDQIPHWSRLGEVTTGGK